MGPRVPHFLRSLTVRAQLFPWLFGPNWSVGRSGPIGPWAVRAQLLDPGPFGPNCWTLGRSGPFVGPWAVRGRSSPIVGPWAIRAQLLDPGPFGPIVWTLGCSGQLVGHVHTPGAVGMSHAQVGHVPCPGWACPMPRGPFWVPFGVTFFVWGPFWVPCGDPFFDGHI